MGPTRAPVTWQNVMTQPYQTERGCRWCLLADIRSALPRMTESGREPEKLRPNLQSSSQNLVLFPQNRGTFHEEIAPNGCQSNCLV
jgi:hypothetical protein